MKIKINKKTAIKGLEYPISKSAITKLFKDILIDSSITISYACVENTSDLVILRSPSEHPLLDWTLLLVACKTDQVDACRALLETDGLARLRDWLITSNIRLKDEPDCWQCFSLTIRLEDDQLSFYRSRSERPYKRPPEGWKSI